MSLGEQKAKRATKGSMTGAPMRLRFVDPDQSEERE
jgi:hypothetical protein